MTVAELIEKLREMPQEMKVYGYPCGSLSPIGNVTLQYVCDDGEYAKIAQEHDEWAVKAVIL